MERLLIPVFLAILACSLCSLKAAFGGALAQTPEGLPWLELSFDTGGEQITWSYNPRDKGRQSSQLRGYSLDLQLQKRGAVQMLRIKLRPPKGKPLSVKSYTAKLTLPTEGLHAVMVPNTRILAHTLIYYHEHKKWPEHTPIIRCLIPESFGEAAYANSEAPFILLTDNKGDNKFAVGWAAAETASMLNGDGENDNYVLTLSRQNDIPFKGDKIEDALIFSAASKPWQEVEEAYATAFDTFNGRKRLPPEEWTYEPVFCTWYCYLDHIDQEGVLKVAKKCKELGFGTILIDAGWDSKPDGGYGDFENGVLGDFVAMPDRFPDLAGAVKQMHDMGLRVELWAAPFWQAKKSKTYEKTKDWHIKRDGKEIHELCPKYPGTRELFREQFQRVARTYGIDGMWVDAADGVPPECQSDHEHLDQPMGSAFVDCLGAARAGLRTVKTDAIVEVRVLHGNLNSKPAIDVIQPSDAPESYEMLRLAGIHLRPWTYDMVLKNDPMMWPKDADTALVGKFLATMVCNGVPALSVDYLTAPEEHCRLTKAWLSFYREHRQTLLKGKFKLFGADYTSPDMMLVGDREAVVYIKNSKTREVVLPQKITRAILLNCTESNELKVRLSMAKGRYSLQSYNPDWTAKGERTAAKKIGDEITIATPQGGGAIVEIM